MLWSPKGVSKMRERMELADYELTLIENLTNTEVCLMKRCEDKAYKKLKMYKTSSLI